VKCIQDLGRNLKETDYLEDRGADEKKFYVYIALVFEWINVAQNRDNWWSSVNKAMTNLVS
jgi:hypothetical protein